jgi:hypothetical protein
MNKDLDERLVPNGEYRDALNAQVDSSEGNDVGTLQNVLGNKLAYPSLMNIAGGKCIGSCRDSANDKIYWFITGTSIDIIAEYDQYTKTVSPVLVDTTGVLDLNRGNLITGVNIIEGLLFFTDNRSEPKVVDIKKFKAGSSNFTTHTTLTTAYSTATYGFTLDDVTVIKKSPIEAPTISMSASARSGIVESVCIAKSFVDGSGEALEPGAHPDSNSNFTFQHAMNLEVGDRLKFTILDESENDEVIATVIDLLSFSPNSFKLNLDSVSDGIVTGTQDWKVLLMEDKSLFEFKFPRFAYRYKYDDGQYSAIGPFSQVAFLPNEFDYMPKKGFNKGMVNSLKKLTISNFITAHIPKDVVEVDILYKEDKSTNVYTVKSLKGKPENQDEEWTNNSMLIESEIIYKILPSVQLLRPWDNVPKKAKAQEFTANRLIYGNYTQQYDIKDVNNAEITPKFSVSIVQSSDSNYGVRTPGKSIKSMRTYQLGVVYKDAFGRETPVLTDTTGSIQLPKSQAVNWNVLNVKILSNPPSWATHYKYFLKETSAEYYNMAMDRHYPAEDGNVWLAFPSAERNKVNDETFLILKKRHDSDAFVEQEARYKIIAIENEAPDFLTIQKVSKGIATADSNGNLFIDGGYPEKGTTKIRIPRTLWKPHFGGTTGSSDDVDLSTASVHTLSDLLVRIKKGNNVTKYYEIANIIYEPTTSNLEFVGTTTDCPEDKFWQINIEKTFDESDVEWLGNVGDGSTIQSVSMTVEIAQKVRKLKPEFQGRFFAKIHRDSTLEQNILNFNNIDELRIISQNNFWQVGNDAGISLGANTGGGQSTRYNFWKKKDKGTGTSFGSGWFIPRFTKFYSWKDLGGEGDVNPNRDLGASSHPHTAVKNTQGYGIRQGETIIELAFHAFGKGARNSKNGQNSVKWGEWVKFGNTVAPQYRDFVNSLQTIGNYIKFSGDPDSTAYEIKGYRRGGAIMFKGRNSNGNGRTGTFGSSRVVIFTIKLDKPIQWAPEDNVPNILDGYHYNTPIQIGTTYVDEDDIDGFTTDNPGIWETEPKEVAELDIYYEASNAYAISTHGNNIALDYHNCYSFANGVESNRIRDDYNATFISKGVKASSTVAEQYNEEVKANGLIFSGIFNSTASVNRLNQFIMAESITKDLNPDYGSIQKLNTRDTDISIFCEDKILKVLTNKDALFNADGNANVTSNRAVLGQAVPYVGDFGISLNPESFSKYGFRSYFTDRARGAVLRLSRDGLEPLSTKGMGDYFHDKLAVTQVAIGSFDESKSSYNISLQSNTVRGSDDTVSFKEQVNGWASRKSYIPENGISLNNTYYTFKDGEMYSHDNEIRNNFYGVQYNTSVKLVMNEMPDVVKGFKTINYEGSKPYYKQNLNDNQYYNNATQYGWYNSAVETDLQSGVANEFKGKEGKFFNYIHGTATTLSNLDTKEFSVQGIGNLVSLSGDVAPANITIKVTENND